MVFVDFSNPYLRDYLVGYLAGHRQRLDDTRARLPSWVAAARAAEGAAGRAPRPLAAVLDIDEIVLANIHMNKFQAPADGQGGEAVDFHACDYYPAPDGRPWPRHDLRLNPLLPGARELMEALRDLGVTIFFITGRLESLREETIENFVFVGLAGGADELFCTEELSAAAGRLIMCPAAEAPAPGRSIRPFKESRRRLIHADYLLVVNIGDQVSDLGRYGDVQVHIAHPFYHTP